MYVSKVQNKDKGNGNHLCPKTHNISEKEKRFPDGQREFESIRLKITLSRKAIRKKDPEVRRQYNHTRNQVKKLTRRLRKQHIEESKI